ncbi:uncharacterized protein LOC108096209 [Drosophila ficusphila]|uniref:uncharacterized protein LOC108096209 n=1 Tax=Drosophila ficusphila TaxID=30025 RepID=UPI0007E7103D|nr:uncharacterized protein LOC108096209 [Drosophila ficusphila]
MIKNVWLIIVFSTTTYSFYKQMACGNCSGINDKCLIETTGWSCEFELDAQKFDPHMNSSGIPESLKKCLLPGMGFKKNKSIFGYCCVWSPETGCQKIKHKDEDIEDRCHRCTRAVWSSVMENKTCPCGTWLFDQRDSSVRAKCGYYMVMYLVTFTLLSL